MNCNGFGWMNEWMNEWDEFENIIRIVKSIKSNKSNVMKCQEQRFFSFKNEK